MALYDKYITKFRFSKCLIDDNTCENSRINSNGLVREILAASNKIHKINHKCLFINPPWVGIQRPTISELTD